MISGQKRTGEGRVVLFAGEKSLVRVGMLGFALAAVCLAWALAHGNRVAPGDDVARVFSFDAALGLFILSTAAVLPFSGLRGTARAFFRRLLIPLTLYGYGAETIQQIRGINPLFTHAGGPLDQIAGGLFGLVALTIVAVYAMLGLAYFRKRAARTRPEMVLGIRYAMIAALVSFAAGIWISVLHSRYMGAHGSLIWLHGLGFHAMQALPLAAWLAERTRFAPAARRAAVHLAGSLYLLGLAAIGLQTALGGAVLTLAFLPCFAAACFLAGIGLAAALSGKALEARVRRSPAIGAHDLNPRAPQLAKSADGGAFSGFSSSKIPRRTGSAPSRR